MGLLDDISKLTQPAAELPDVEDDFDASSLVKPTGNRAKNKLQNFNFDEGKYAGVAVSSKDIFGDVSEISGLKAKDSESEDDLDDEAEDEEDFEEESDVEMEEDVGEKKKKSNILENLADSDEDEEMNDEEEEDGDSGDDEKEEEDDGDEEEGANLKMTTLSLRDDSDKTEKATSVLHQRQVWDDLSYSNIRIHALLNAMNQMPRGDARRELVKNCDPSTQKSMEAAMENMAKLRDLMAKAGGFFEEKSGKTEDSDDEEIPSDDEEILSDSEGLDDEEEEEEDEAPKKKAENQGTSLKSLKKNLETLDGSIDKFRAATLTKWYNRTKVLSSKSMNNADFSVFEKGSILGQINKVLADEDKLLKKVHTNRSGKTRLGASAFSDSHDPEIFDDSDFYQVLLKQMLEARSQMNQNSQDGADMTRNYMELQSMISNKKKRDVSQLSSKDRKLNYEPIAKLINFYPSKPSVATWSHESRNELFKSLFS